MSTYITLQGSITYSDKKSLNKSVKTLKTGRWMNSDECLIDESGMVIGDGQEPDIDGLTISFPMSLYRNIGYILKELVKGCSFFNLVWTCTDDGFTGGVFKGEQETLYNLLDFAKSLNIGEIPFAGQSRMDWLVEVESAFFEEYA